MYIVVVSGKWAKGEVCWQMYKTCVKFCRWIQIYPFCHWSRCLSQFWPTTDLAVCETLETNVVVYLSCIFATVSENIGPYLKTIQTRDNSDGLAYALLEVKNNLSDMGAAPFQAFRLSAVHKGLASFSTELQQDLNFETIRHQVHRAGSSFNKGQKRSLNTLAVLSCQVLL